MSINKQILKALNEAQQEQKLEVPFNWTLNSDGSYDVKGNISESDVKSFSTYGVLDVKFNKVSGNFNLDYETSTSTKNCPKEVGGNFNAVVDVDSLDFSDGFPEKIGGNVDVKNKFTKNCKNCKINGSINLLSPKDLTNCPNCYKLNIHCNSNLESLIGCPETTEIEFLGCWDRFGDNVIDDNEITEFDKFLMANKKYLPNRCKIKVDGKRYEYK